MKRGLALVLSIVMLMGLLTFAGCSSDEGSDPDGTVAPGTTEAPKESDLTIVKSDMESAIEDYAIGFRKEDNTLRNEVQKLLCEMKADGTVEKIATEWFGSDVTTIPETFTPKEGAEDDSLQKVKDAGVLKLGLDDSFPPMGYRNDDNEIVGFDIDLAKEVCKRMGVELELVPIVWDSNIMELDTRNVDCLWNGMSVNDEREAAMNLSEPYMKNEMVFVVKDNTGFFSQADVLDKKIGVQAGSTVEEILEGSEIQDLAAEIVPFENNTNAILDLRSGGVDVVFMDIVVANYILSQDQ